jgi:HEPN domain-containing protein
MHLTKYYDEYEKSHDVIGMYRELSKQFCGTKDLTHAVKLSRKYFNEARYSDKEKDLYSEAFAREFIGYVGDVKDYIDNECVAESGDLEGKSENLTEK